MMTYSFNSKPVLFEVKKRGLLVLIKGYNGYF